MGKKKWFKMKKVKYKRYIQIIKFCNMMRAKDKSFLGFKSIKYAMKKKLVMTYRYIHKTKKIYLITPHSEGFIDIEYKDKRSK